MIARPPVDRRLLLLAPLGLVALGGAGFYAMLNRMQAGDFDPHGIPSPLIGKPVPPFTLPALAPKQGFASADLTGAAHPILVNFFASWCEPCIIEAPELATLSQSGVAIWGVNYKDQPTAAASFLSEHGNPYERIAYDQPGRVAIDFGLYGVPETFFIDKTGIIRWRWAGPLTASVATTQLNPLLRKYA